MTRKLKMGLRLAGINTFDPKKPGNVQGDELVARSWIKYLTRLDGVECVELYGPTGSMTSTLDLVVHFTPQAELHPTAKNILYLQNAYPPQQYQGGTVGVFNHVRHRYSGFLFTSERLMQTCAPGAVIPFAADPEDFYPQVAPEYRHPVSFVGNDIRGAETNARYIAPAGPFGLVIYGNPWPPPYQQYCLGKLPMPDLPKLYHNSLINLNAHIPIHNEFETVNSRIFEALACEGFLLSDFNVGVERDFGEAIVFTEGHHDMWAKLVRYLADAPLRRKKAELGRQLVLAHHTYAHRALEILKYLQAVV